MELVEITKQNLDIYLNLAQAYEAEFSRYTDKQPNQDGLFTPDTIPLKPFCGYLLYDDNAPSGFCVLDLTKLVYDIREFYIIPVKRKQTLGQQLALTIFERFPGQWQIRQLESATQATSFWRKVVGRVTNNQFFEDSIPDKEWGSVIAQRFHIECVNRSG